MKTLATLIAALTIASNAIAAPQWMTQYVAIVKSEPKVKDAAWPNGSTFDFYVSVKDNGDNRDGYAEYLCLLRGGLEMPEGVKYTITVWDAGSADTQLGSFDCGF